MDSITIITEELVSKKDAIIKEAINRRLGVDWSLTDLQGRCTITSSPNTYETYYLDGEPIVMFGGVVFSDERDEDGSLRHMTSIMYKFIELPENQIHLSLKGAQDVFNWLEKNKWQT